MSCPCGVGQTFELCCGPYLSGARRPPTAEALMRSRYTAYTRADVDYLARTLAPECRATFDRRAAKRWATDSEWLGLRIVATENGQAWDDAGVVEFVATFRKKGKVLEHRERSRFRKSGLGEWFFVEGAPVSRA